MFNTNFKPNFGFNSPNNLIKTSYDTLVDNVRASSGLDFTPQRTVISDPFGSTIGRIDLPGKIVGLDNSFTGFSIKQDTITDIYGSQIAKVDPFGRLQDNLGRDLGIYVK